MRHAQLMAALSAAALQDIASVIRRHSFTESVSLHFVPYIRLIRSFHSSSLNQANNSVDYSTSERDFATELSAPNSVARCCAGRRMRLPRSLPHPERCGYADKTRFGAKIDGCAIKRRTTGPTLLRSSTRYRQATTARRVPPANGADSRRD
jgi:hypothetical protein